MKIVSVVGARPQLIKAALVSGALARAGHEELLVHTGQHYDHQMSQVFVDELGGRPPDVNLRVGSGSGGWQTATMLLGLESVLTKQRPDWVLVYGDTNSTLAAALAAAKMGIPLAHVEAGLRSFNREMPEEHNRVLTDHCSDLLLCPTQTAVDHLEREGIVRGVHLVGDVMLDALLAFRARAENRAGALLSEHGLNAKEYVLATVHRPYNTDHPEVLRGILSAFDALTEPLLFPVHPRTRARIDDLGWTPAPGVHLCPPLGYLDLRGLPSRARVILTDSGGIQKEAYLLGVPCVTLRPETEWTETVNAGWNLLVGHDPAAISAAVKSFAPSHDRPPLFGTGAASDAIAALLI